MRRCAWAVLGLGLWAGGVGGGVGGGARAVRRGKVRAHVGRARFVWLPLREGVVPPSLFRGPGGGGGGGRGRGGWGAGVWGGGGGGGGGGGHGGRTPDPRL